MKTQKKFYYQIEKYFPTLLGGEIENFDGEIVADDEICARDAIQDRHSGYDDLLELFEIL